VLPILAFLPLAQVEPTAPLQVPVSYGGIAAIVFGGVVVFLGVAFYLLREFQADRAALVEEVRTQLEAGAKAQQVEVQSPLTITPHVLYVPQQAHDDLEAEFRAFTARTDQRFTAMSQASSESREKIYRLIREEMAAMNTRFTDLLGAMRELKGEIKHLSK
jgi:hypothetical protein